MPKRLPSQNLSLFDLALKSVCRLSRMSAGAAHLLLFLIRTHDFDECFVFRDNFCSNAVQEFDTWKFRRQLILLLVKDSEPTVEFSDLFLSLLFIYPNAVELEKTITFSDDGLFLFKVFQFLRFKYCV